MADSSSFSRWILALAIVAVVLVVAVGPALEPLRFVDDPMGKALSALGALLVVALFVERAQQVYIGVWRGLERTKLDQAVRKATAELELAKAAQPPDQGSIAARQAALDAAAAALAEYRTWTKKYAFLSGLLLGVVISLVGPRLLAEVLQGTENLSGWQDNAFVAIDVFVTGGLIGGGAEGIHQLVALLTDYLEKTRDKLANPAALAQGGQQP